MSYTVSIEKGMEIGLNKKILKTLDYEKILYRLSHHAATTLGKEAAAKLEPIGHFEEVQQRLQATDEAANVERLKGNAPFGGIRDIRAAVHRARIGGVLNPAELLDIATTMMGTRRLKRFLAEQHAEHPIPMLKELSELLTENKPVEDSINGCIDENAAVMDSASSELGRIRSELRTGEARVRERLEQMIRTPSIQKMLQDVLVTIRNDRYVIPVKHEYRASFGGMIHDQSASGATLLDRKSVV